MARLLIVESMLLACLLFVAGFALWETLGTALGMDRVWHSLVEMRQSGNQDFVLFLLVVLAVCGLPMAVYWTLQFFRMTRLSFWIVTLAALAPQMPAALSHNRLDWPSFWSVPWFTTGLSELTVALIFLASLAMLVALHRIGELRRLRSRLASLRLDRREQERVVSSELLVLTALVGGVLALTAGLFAAGAFISRAEVVFDLPPWGVLTIGTAAILLVAAALSLWSLRSEAR